ncbi:glycosyltransferase family 4 protein [Elizabethkingia sp. HX XZB]|uniref:glycosyltransferase family 4 protein n=1 Tax=Elizabethkingia sp. HX XZB TaxID=3003193 RepID=UPI002A23C084|nr:glycosyltransferase family 4 protein [Elizabethkingia sp. HX XZB]MDX8568447.1 glycosyltransferase family 4 protein [Elizabethkingia sp. HX XZB]
MNIIFLTLVEVNSIEERGIYQDLLRKFRDKKHDVTIVSPVERRKKISTNIKQKDGVTILQVKTLNIQKINIIEKGIGTLAIEYQFLSAIKQYLPQKKFDLILYSTPPITFARVIEYIKKRDDAYSYLLLKDIFPQNAVDMKMIKKGSFIYKLFLKKEKRLYEISDTIGCMSPANVNFVLNHNPEISSEKVEVNPNTIEPVNYNYSTKEKNKIREKYNVPVDKKILVYGGNLGKPQGLDFLLETIYTTKQNDAFFLIVGDGTEFLKMKLWFETHKPSNAKLLQRLPKEDYDKLLAACDIGLIFLDKNFLIPNFPSRLLSYLEMKMPILAATDPNTDIGTIVEESGCGYKVLAGNQNDMQEKLNKMLKDDLSRLAENGVKLLYEKYTVSNSYDLIINKFQ